MINMLCVFTKHAHLPIFREAIHYLVIISPLHYTNSIEELVNKMNEEHGKRAKLMPTLQSDQEIIAVVTEKIGAAPTALTFDDDNRLIKLGLSGLALTQLPPELWQ